MTSCDESGAEEPIDAVYLWVDGNNEHTSRRLDVALARNPDAAESSFANRRFRDHGELRYSLRSIELYAPWVRRIFLVTDGSRPDWLRADHPRLTVITHDEIFADADDLPTFNSDAIALQLHRIPGLSRHFLVVNDDCFFGRPVALEDFRRPDGRAVVYLEAPGMIDPNDKALEHTRRIVEREFPGVESDVFAHTPQLYDRDVLACLENLLPAEFRRTSASCFRTRQDLVLRVLYPAAAVAGVDGVPPAEVRTLRWRSPEYCFVMLTDDVKPALRALMYVETMRPRFICVNDDLGDEPTSSFVGTALTRTLDAMYSEPSEFENDGRLPSGHGVGTDSHAAALWNRRLSRHWSSAGVGSLAYGTAFNTWRNRARVRVFRRAVSRLDVRWERARVLDVGTGTGLYLDEWKRLGVRRLAGVDIADEAIRRLRPRYPDVELHRADVGSGALPFGDGAFDVVSAFAVLFHVVDDERYRAALRSLSAALAGGGYLIFTESALRTERRVGRYWVGRAEATLSAAVAGAGLEVVARIPETVLLSPPQRLGPRWTNAWERLMRLTSGREWAGGAVGAFAYPFEVALAVALRRGPSTDLIVCRKV